MALQSKVLIIDSPTATGNQSYTGAGFQPKAAVCLTSLADVDGFEVDYRMGIGVASGSVAEAQRAASIGVDDNVATTVAGRAWRSALALLVNLAGSAVTLEATLVSFDADGLTLNWVTVQATSRRVAILLLGGADLTNAKVLEFAANTATGNQAVTGVGFQADALIFLTAARIALGYTSNAVFCCGAAKSATARHALSIAAADAATLAANVNALSTQRTDRCLIGINASGEAVDMEADFVSMDVDGFTINWIDAPPTAMLCAVLALKGGQYAIGASAKPTGAAPVNQDVDIGFPPKAALWASWNKIAAATVQADGEGSFGLGDGTAEGTVWGEELDATINTQANHSFVATKALRLASSVSTINAEADHSFVGNSWRLAWTTNDAVAKEILYFAAGDAAAAAAGHGRLLTLGVG